MNENFQDRILLCADCKGEFVFTAGEQLFFYDKQFKNDPKRCKPCKSRRSGVSSAAPGSGPVVAGLSRTETRTECSACGVQTTVPFKPTQGRPVLCRSCFQVRNRAAHPAEIAAAAVTQAPPEPLSARETISALDALVPESVLPDAAVLAAASMASASEGSSVASAADLASIVASPEVAEAALAVIPAELLHAETHGAELQVAIVESADA
jgi:CxxC-x17-CxxC domain-containing protein